MLQIYTLVNTLLQILSNNYQRKCINFAVKIPLMEQTKDWSVLWKVVLTISFILSNVLFLALPSDLDKARNLFSLLYLSIVYFLPVLFIVIAAHEFTWDREKGLLTAISLRVMSFYYLGVCLCLVV